MKNSLPTVNADEKNIQERIKVFALDMDGTVYLDENWIDGAREFLERIWESGRDYVFLTNNSSKDPQTYVAKLGRMGLFVDQDRIVTSGQATIWYLKREYPGKKVFLLGNDLLKHEFEEEGIELTEEGAEVAVLGFDTSVDYRKLCIMCDLVRSGLPYIATHPDFNCPTATGFIPDAGALAELIHASAFRYPDRVIGKPNTDISDYLIDRLKKRLGREVERDEIAMVGDRLYTDIAAGVNAGLHTILVLSGEATLKDAEASEVRPELIYDSVDGLLRAGG